MSLPPDDELASRICVALMRLGTRMAVGFDQYFADSGVTRAQFRVMTAIWNIGQHDGATPSALSEYLFIERANGLGAAQAHARRRIAVATGGSGSM